MNSPRRINATVVGIYLLAGLLGANLLVMLNRDSSPRWLPAAYGDARQAPIAGGAGVFVMPAQLSSNTWGCYLMDVDKGTLCVYQFFPGAKQLQFVAARRFTSDTKLDNFNTAPPPQEISDLVEKKNGPVRNGVGNNPPVDDPSRKNPE
jgi:hypothetical protein